MGILFYHEFFTIADIYAWGCRLAVELTSVNRVPSISFIVKFPFSVFNLNDSRGLAVLAEVQHKGAYARLL